MKVDVKTNQELNESNLVPEGIYEFVVTKAEEKISQSGNEMIRLSLQIWDKAGKEHFVFCNLLNAMPHLLKHFCEATNLMDSYNSGILTHYNCENVSGHCKIIIEKGKIKCPSPLEFYPDKNVVKDFLNYEAKKSVNSEMDITF